MISVENIKVEILFGFGTPQYQEYTSSNCQLENQMKITENDFIKL